MCLANLALCDPGDSILPVALFALGVAFFAATQDIAIDAWRIESASADKQGAITKVSVFLSHAVTGYWWLIFPIMFFVLLWPFARWVAKLERDMLMRQK